MPTAHFVSTGDSNSGIERLRIGSDGTSFFKGGVAVIAPVPYLSLLSPPGGNIPCSIEGGVGTKIDWSDYQTRWTINLGDGIPEGPGNAGCNFTITRADNNGAVLGTPLTIDRASGQVIVAQDPPTQPQSVATKKYVDAKVAAVPVPDLSSRVKIAGDTMTGALEVKTADPAIVINSTGTTGYPDVRFRRQDKERWIVRASNETESGSNVGSNFELIGLNDAGSGITAKPLVINRADGRITLAADPTAALGAATKQYVDAGVRPVNNIAVSTYTLVLTDVGKTLVGYIGSTITVPANATVAIPIGAQIDLAVSSPFAMTVAPAGGVTLYSENSKRKLPILGSCGTLTKINTDTWMLCGSLIA